MTDIRGHEGLTNNGTTGTRVQRDMVDAKDSGRIIRVSTSKPVLVSMIRRPLGGSWTRTRGGERIRARL